MTDDPLDRLFRAGGRNALLAWAMTGVLALVFVESLLQLDLRWLLLVGVAGVVVLLPPFVFRNWWVVLPWELLGLALLPILVRAIAGGTLGTFATYLSLAALSLLVVVELHMFTALSVTHWFAVALVAMATLAAVAVWTVFRWTADRWLGTTYLADNTALMTEWHWVALAGVVAGVLFDSYFRRRDRLLWRVVRRAVDRRVCCRGRPCGPSGASREQCRSSSRW